MSLSQAFLNTDYSTWFLILSRYLMELHFVPFKYFYLCSSANLHASNTYIWALNRKMFFNKVVHHCLIITSPKFSNWIEVIDQYISLRLLENQQYAYLIFCMSILKFETQIFEYLSSGPDLMRVRRGRRLKARSSRGPRIRQITSLSPLLNTVKHFLLQWKEQSNGLAWI